MPSIKFSYLYRDSGNYKTYGSVVFANPDDIELSTVDALIRSKLIDQEWFYADEWNLPDLRLLILTDNTDPTWHEFESIQFTDEAANDTRCIEVFVAQ